MNNQEDNDKIYKYADYLIDKKQHRVNKYFKNIGINGENEMDEIIPNLYLGNYKAAYNLKKLKEKNIKNVVIICDNIETPFENVGIKYFSIPIKDRELEEEYFINGIEVNEYMISQLTRAILFIFDCLRNNEGVLVHCKKGASRSAYLVKYFLMLYNNYKSKEAEEFIKNKRPIAFPSYKNISKYEKIIIPHKKLFKQYFNSY